MLAAGDPYFGWRGLLTGRSETYEIPGDHVGIFHEPNVQVLAQKLGACLENATQVETSVNLRQLGRHGSALSRRSYGD
jgi:thioesterase domain-containing protein